MNWKIRQLPPLFSLRIVSVFVFVLISLPTSYAFQAHAQTPPTASLTFSPETITAQINSEFTTELTLNTAGQKVGGVGAKIFYDPTVIHIEKIETLPVFPDFPSQTFDNSLGKATISGIVQNPDQLYTGEAVFAKITWKAVNVGSGKITFDFVPNSTKDSNIAVLYGSGDILQRVNQVEFTVTTETQGGVDTKVSQENPPTAASLSFPADRSTLFNIFIIGILIASQISLWHKNQEIEKKVDLIAKIESSKKQLGS